LSDEQRQVLKTALAGHNLLLSVQARTGKLYVVNGLGTLRGWGKKVVVVCSSGISCLVYGEGVKSSTVHSHYALQTADMPAEMVIERSASIPHFVKRIKAADTIIWDEAGMSSKRIFQLVNAIQHEIADERDISKPFASKQMILVGEFLQLKPLPGTFDDGEFMLHSRLFTVAIPYRFELKQLMRQNLAEKTFITALKELRQGICSPETEGFLKCLDRPLEGDAIDIFFTKLLV